MDRGSTVLVKMCLQTRRQVTQIQIPTHLHWEVAGWWRDHNKQPMHFHLFIIKRKEKK
jgi:hypothetical protein